MLRMGAAVIAMEVAALLVALLTFGWPVLLIGVPLLVGTVFVLLFVRLSEKPRQLLEKQRSLRWDPTAVTPGGLMSGFFEVSAVPGPDSPRSAVRR